MHQGRGVPGAEGLRLDPGAHACASERLRQEQAARQETHERLHGLGSSRAQEAGGSVSTPAQRRAQQDPRKTLAVRERKFTLFFSVSVCLFRTALEV